MIVLPGGGVIYGEPGAPQGEAPPAPAPPPVAAPWVSLPSVDLPDVNVTLPNVDLPDVNLTPTVNLAIDYQAIAAIAAVCVGSLWLLDRLVLGGYGTRRVIRGGGA